MQRFIRGYLVNIIINTICIFFFYYGAEYEEGTYACCHRNGNEKIVVHEQEDELHKEFLKRVTRTISKKLYVIGSSILQEIKYIED